MSFLVYNENNKIKKQQEEAKKREEAKKQDGNKDEDPAEFFSTTLPQTMGISYPQPVTPFLNACVPSMAHWLKAFVDFGCTNEECLITVSTWDDHKILHFLRQVSDCGADGNKLSDMDMLVLIDHFLTYFKAEH